MSIFLFILLTAVSFCGDFHFVFHSENDYSSLKWLPCDGKPVLLFFGEKGDYFSERQLSILRTKRVQSFLQHGYSVQTYMDKRQFFDRYHAFKVGTYPTMVFLDTKARIYSYGVLVNNEEQMLHMLKDRLSMEERHRFILPEYRLALYFKWGEMKRFFKLLKDSRNHVPLQYQYYFQAIGYWWAGNKSLSRYYELKLLIEFPDAPFYGEVLRRYCERFLVSGDEEIDFLHSELERFGTDKTEVLSLIGNYL